MVASSVQVETQCRVVNSFLTMDFWDLGVTLPWSIQMFPQLLSILSGHLCILITWDPHKRIKCSMDKQNFFAGRKVEHMEVQPYVERAVHVVCVTPESQLWLPIH
jgi:hypothetical protein